MRQERPPIEILWCANRRRPRHDGWSFPREVEIKLRELCGDGTVLHLFGGKARHGIRVDIDPTVRPDVVADAWLPPFGENSFDTVILDPPYFSLNTQVRVALFCTAAHIARKQVLWLHTIWLHPAVGLKLERAWLIRVGDSSTVRCLQVFERTARRIHTPRHFHRGPAIKYNRWLADCRPLEFPEEAA